MIDAHRDRFGVEPICRVVGVPASTYYAATRRPPSARRRRDTQLKLEIQRVFDDNYQLYGARKIWRQLHREGFKVARCTVERLMGELGIAGSCAARPRGPRSTTSKLHDPLTWSNATSPRPVGTNCGLPI